MNKIESFSSQLFTKQSQLSQDLLCRGRQRVCAVVKKIFLSLAQLLVSTLVFVFVAPLGIVTTSPKIKAVAAILFYHMKSGFRNFFLGCQAIADIPTEQKVLSARIAEEELKEGAHQLLLEAREFKPSSI